MNRAASFTGPTIRPVRRALCTTGWRWRPTYVKVGERSFSVEGAPGKRLYRTIEMARTDNDRYSFTISQPVDSDSRAHPVLFVIGGFGGGHWVLDWMPHHGQNSIISYQYPYDRQRWAAGSTALRLRFAMSVANRFTEQVIGMMAWAREQAWADSKRLTLAGFSLGALALPALYHTAMKNGLGLSAGVIAYGGADFNRIARANLGVEPAWLGRATAWIAGLTLNAFEPARHLPHLSGEFLFINGMSDQRIPMESALEMHRLAPKSKTVIFLPGPHIDGDRKRYTRAVDVTRRWLLERGAING